MKIFAGAIIDAIVAIVIDNITEKQTTMELTPFIVGIAIVLFILFTGLIILLDKLQKFNRAVSREINFHNRFNEMVYQNMPEIWDEYSKKIENTIELNPIDNDEWDWLYMFDRSNPFKKRDNLKHEFSRNNKPIS